MKAAFILKLKGPSSRKKRKKRRAFTLVELLIVIAIIAVLVGLLLPAVQKVRDAANKIRCQNTLKQLAIGCMSYHDENGTLPRGGRWVPYPPATNKWAGPRENWIFHMLPYIEQESLYRKLTQLPSYSSPNEVAFPQQEGGNPTTQTIVSHMPFLRCPADGQFLQLAISNYCASMGPTCLDAPSGCQDLGFNTYCTQPGWGYKCASGAHNGNTNLLNETLGMFTRLGTPVQLSDVLDGTSNTILLGESTSGELDHLSKVGYFVSANGGNEHSSTVVPINYRTTYQDPANGQCANNNQNRHNWDNWKGSWGFKSNHTGGANFVFVDGSVHFLAENIDMKAYQLLGCRNDGQPPGDY